MSRRRKRKPARASTKPRGPAPPGPAAGQPCARGALTRHLEWVAAVVLILAVTGVLFSKTYDCELMGWDSYPIIIASRVQSLTDFAGTFTEKLMDGRYAGDFYRPLLNLTFALDYALWGLTPFGYQLTSTLLFAGCAAALFFFVRRAVGADAAVAPLVALLFFLLHATHYEVIPVPARRPETLCCLFMALALAWQLSPRSLASRRPPIVPAVFTLLAIASKETALILPALSFLVVLLYSPRSRFVQRFWHAVIAAVPHVTALAVMIVARLAVLGGLGGHEATRMSEGFSRLPACGANVLQWLLFPQPLMQKAFAGKLLLIALAAGLVLVGVTTLLSRPRGAPDRPAQRHLGRTTLLAVAWLVLLWLTYAVGGKVEPWYLLLAVAGLAMVFGAFADGLVAATRRGPPPVRVVAAATLVLSATLVVWQGRYSPLVCKYDGWDRAGVASRQFLAQLEEAIARAPDGSIVRAPPIPMWVQPQTDRPHIRGGAVLKGRSVQAWAELVFPERRVRVARTRADQPAPDELLVVLTRPLEGFQPIMLLARPAGN